MLPLLLLVIACLWPASGAIGEADGSGSSAVQLQYKFVPGTLTRYQIVQELAGTRVFPGSEQESPISAKLTTVIRVRCTKTLADGSMELAIDTESGTLEMAGRPSNYKPPQVVRRLTITPAGRIITPSGGGPKDEDERTRSPLDFGSPDSIVMLAILPQQPVQPGSSWEAELPLPIDPSAKLKLGFTLAKVTAGTDGRVASVRQTLSTPINTTSGGEVRAVQGSQHGEADLLFSIDRGMLISATGTIVSNVVAAMAAPSVPGAAATEGVYKVKVDSKFTVVGMGTVVETRQSGAR